MGCLGMGLIVLGFGKSVHLAVVGFEIPDSEIDYRFLGFGIDCLFLDSEIGYHYLGLQTDCLFPDLGIDCLIPDSEIDCLCLDLEIGLQDSAVLDSGRIDHFVDLESQDLEKMDLLQTAAWLT